MTTIHGVYHEFGKQNSVDQPGNGSQRPHRKGPAFWAQIFGGRLAG